MAYAKYARELSLGSLTTLAFIVIVFGNQATTYNNRDRRHLWSSRPSVWVVIASIAGIVIASVLAITGIAMSPLPALVVFSTLATSVAFAVLFDFAKVPVFRKLHIDQGCA